MPVWKWWPRRPTIGTLLGPRLGRRSWNGIDAGPDLAALCLNGE